MAGWRQTSRQRQTRKPTCKRTTHKQPTCKWTCKPTCKRACKPTCKPISNMQADNGKNKRTRTHTDITIRSWQYRPAGKAQHRSDRTNTESSGSRPAGTKKARHDAVHITNTESSGSRHKTFVANMQSATRSNTHSRICGHYRHKTYEGQNELMNVDSGTGRSTTSNLI